MTRKSTFAICLYKQKTNVPQKLKAFDKNLRRWSERQIKHWKSSVLLGWFNIINWNVKIHRNYHHNWKHSNQKRLRNSKYCKVYQNTFSKNTFGWLLLKIISKCINGDFFSNERNWGITPGAWSTLYGSYDFMRKIEVEDLMIPCSIL